MHHRLETGQHPITTQRMSRWMVGHTNSQSVSGTRGLVRDDFQPRQFNKHNREMTGAALFIAHVLKMYTKSQIDKKKINLVLQRLLL